jgi:Skp family chaperone for outer membrane proteins
LFAFQASVDDIASMIASKNVELEQLQQEFEDLTAQLQEASKKKSSPAKTSAKAKTGKKTGGKKRASVESSSASASPRETATSEDEAAPASVLDMFSGALQTVVSSGEYLFEKRAYILFPAVVAVFHIYGEYASV